MSIKRMDNVGITFKDLKAAIKFFQELGMELVGEAPIEGKWAEKVVGLKKMKCNIAMLQTPDGLSKLEIVQFQSPKAIKPKKVMPNTLGMGRIMFNVVGIDDVVKRLKKHGAKLIGEIVNYQDIYRLCYIRGPEGIIIGLAEGP